MVKGKKQPLVIRHTPHFFISLGRRAGSELNRNYISRSTFVDTIRHHGHHTYTRTTPHHLVMSIFMHLLVHFLQDFHPFSSHWNFNFPKWLQRHGLGSFVKPKPFEAIVFSIKKKNSCLCEAYMKTLTLGMFQTGFDRAHQSKWNVLLCRQL